ncbi:MAG: lytic transglycosylase domain-containing protein [Betaproteobacteria bacterium]|nr:lytic transglycosylase domain-containing protein [Betaproteobacteria bacterium]
MNRILALLMALAAGLAHGSKLDDEFLAAREAFRAGHGARLEAHAKRLKGHILEPYVTYWRLSLRLADTAPEEIRAFLAANRDGPLAERMRNDWLKQLGKTRQWELFRQELPLLVGDDLEITCYALQSRLEHDGAEALREARAVWFIPRALPDSCMPLVSALAGAQLLSTEDVWMRIRVALEAGRVTAARRFAELLPAGQAPEARVLEAIASDPNGYLERRGLNLRTRAGREAAMFAVHRLARTAPQPAARHWAKLEERFSAEERGYVWGMLGHLGAMRHQPDALAWFQRAGDLSDVQLAWKARAALRAQSWPDVLEAVDAMIGTEANDPAWRYWKARALRELGRAEESEALFRPLAAEFNFYGLLAQEELGARIAVPSAPFKPSAEDVRAMNQLPGFSRALEFYRLNLRPEANREWLWTIRGFDDQQLLAAAELARRYDVYDRAIGTAERTVEVHDFGLRYLAPYRDVLKTHAARFALDEAWVYGLIRQESRFIADARSHAGASGLMQLMPATARWVAKQLGFKDWRWSQVNEIDVNVRLGTYYLRHVLDALDGHPVLASAAYNAGPGRARAWRPDTAVEGAIYAETIPFNETRDYVKKVMSNATFYAHSFGDTMQSLRQRIGIVSPRRRDRESSLNDTP